MARVDIDNKTVDRYSVWHHRFDEATNHFKWFCVDCFDTESEMEALLKNLRSDLEIRVRAGDAHFKEQIVGRISKNPRKFTRFFSN